jgi:hypothetical protein
MNWAWIDGHLTEHEMELEHGMELEKIKAEEKKKLVEFNEAVAVGGGRVYPLDQGKGDRLTIQRIYGMVQGLNESIKNWKGA